MDAKTTDQRTQGAPPGATGPSTPEGPPIKLPHCTIDVHQGALSLRHELSKILNRFGLWGQVISDAATRERGAGEQDFHQWVRSTLRHARNLAVESMALIDQVAERNSIRLPTPPPLLAVDPSWRPQGGGGQTIDAVGEIVLVLMAVEIQSYGRALGDYSDTSEPPLPAHANKDVEDLMQATTLLHRLRRHTYSLEFQYLKSLSKSYAGDPRTVRMQGQLTQEQYSDLVSLISEHHRDPGDPEIRSKGVVVADINEALLQKLIADSCQVILCYRGDTIVGVSLFNAPEACPQHLREVDNALGGDTNAAGTLILTSRSEQGSLVFPMLMNATMTAAAGAGATRIIGEVMSENERAMAAYAKYGGEIHPDKTRTRFAPSGKLATFVAVSIPIFTEAAAAPPSESSRQKEVATVPS